MQEQVIAIDEIETKPLKRADRLHRSTVARRRRKSKKELMVLKQQNQYAAARRLRKQKVKYASTMG
jgi:rRNA pseudouridine-1189 N-methylase Emg1 (Nep1/Mra1 family)